MNPKHEFYDYPSFMEPITILCMLFALLCMCMMFMYESKSQRKEIINKSLLLIFAAVFVYFFIMNINRELDESKAKREQLIKEIE